MPLVKNNFGIIGNARNISSSTTSGFLGSIMDHQIYKGAGNWPAAYPASVEFLVVAGGGGGSDFIGGGGGAGGYRAGIRSGIVNNTNYTITVGAGGPQNTNGNNSVFDTVTSTAGGRGGRADSGPTGQNGGSGGGGAGPNNTTGGSATAITPISGETTSVQGFGGGSGGGSGGGGNASGGGGGGATAAGGNLTSNQQPGLGGKGATNTITGATVAYAGGGGGGGDGQGNTAAGGSAPSSDANSPYGAGTGSGNGTGGNGVANTGGGAGGGRTGGGTGGSGVVIIAYESSFSNIASISAGLTYTYIASRAGYRVYRFTAGTGTISW